MTNPSKAWITTEWKKSEKEYLKFDYLLYKQEVVGLTVAEERDGFWIVYLETKAGRTIAWTIKSKEVTKSKLDIKSYINKFLYGSVNLT